MRFNGPECAPGGAKSHSQMPDCSLILKMGCLNPQPLIVRAMSEFKYACPVCGQHIKCDSSQAGTTMECPTCFQKIVVPQAPASDNPKFILHGKKVGAERPVPTVVANAKPLPPPVPEKSFRTPAILVAVLVLLAAVLAIMFHGKFFKSTGGPASQGPTASNGMPTPSPVPPKPITGLAMVVFGKGDSLVPGTGTAEAEVKDPAKAAFLAAFKADLACPLAFEGPVGLTPLSGNGRTVPGATGEIHYLGSFPGGLVIGVSLAGLVPNHDYVLTLNGAVQHAGNDNLPDQWSRNSKQKHYDFSRITTDANGCYQATFGIRLPVGSYDVYFFVKDTSDWKIVLSRDFFKFTVE
jgi:DNA-directed RNA polymerase subunit RPC12/RpoP